MCCPFLFDNWPFKDGGSGASAAAFSLWKGFLRKSLSKRRQKSALPIFGKKLNEEKSKGQTRKKLEEILRMFDKAPSPSSENSVQNQAQQHNKQPRQIPQRQRCSQQTVHSSKQSSKKGKFQSNQGRNLSLKRQLAGKRRLKKQFAKKISSPANLYLRHGKNPC